MAGIQGKSKTDPKKNNMELTARQIAILDHQLTKPKRASGKMSVNSALKRIGISSRTYYKDLKKINVSDWKERQKERLKQLGDLAIANIIYNLEKGNYDAGRDWMNKFAHLYTDQIDVVGRMQSMSDDELVTGMKTAILTALQDKAKNKGIKGLPEPKKSLGEAENGSGRHCRGDISDRVTIHEEREFDGRGIA